MSVAKDQNAVIALTKLLDEAREDEPYCLTERLPEGFVTQEPSPWLWRPAAGAAPDTLPPLRSAAAYALFADREWSGTPHEATPPAERGPQPALPWPAILHEPPSRAIDATIGPLTSAQLKYCRTSIDVTMRGGTTSGVVYPTALCELARKFRFRNIGGASAGAIAAALVAAAELGRSRWDRAGRPDLGELSPAERQHGRVRQGLLGMADATAWFSQADRKPKAKRDEYRVAQLFRPTASARPLYRLAVAVMRGRWLGFGSLLLWSFGLRSRLVTAALLLLVPLLLILPLPPIRPDLPVSLPAYLLAVAWLATLTVTAVGLIVTSLTFRAWLNPPESLAGDLAEPVASAPRRGSPLGWLYGLLALNIGMTAVVALVGFTDTWSRFGGWRILALWFVLMMALLLVCIFSMWFVLKDAKAQKFGLVSGAVGPGTFRRGGRGWLWDWIAGLAPSTFDDALVPWLSRSMSRLAGLPEGEVLRFGHLWLDTAYAPPTGGPAEGSAPSEPALLRLAAADAKARVVNLELMTTELVHGVPYRWPLRENDQSQLVDGGRVPRLYFRRADLLTRDAEMFPKEVVDAMCTGGTAVPVAFDIETGREITDLHPLPAPWDLPVIFATRMSMALPALLQAVPLYRVVSDQRPESAEEPHPIRDDFGARIRTKDGGDVDYPAGGGKVWVEELWFSDGGITSNFPIHLFDAPMPLWPTVGINLGSHPNGHQHQDVWLPSDSQARTSPPEPQRGSMFGFIAAIVSTARGWADTSQTFMPAFRGRIAWVRQRSEEGGTNLFMPRATIASLALRGAVAGARLARRFSDEAQWQRHQWLRMRVAMGNLSTLRRQVYGALRFPTYVDLLTDPSSRWFSAGSTATVEGIRDALRARGGDPNPAEAIPDQADGALDWFPVGDTYWEVAREVAAGFSAYDDAVLTLGSPEPTPVIRQVPPV